MSETTHAPRADPSPFVPGVRPPEPATIVIFGGTGDLATRKLFPALFGLWHAGFLPERFALAGVSNLEFTDESFRDLIAKSVAEHHPDATPAAAAKFAARAVYQVVDFGKPEDLTALGRRLADVERDRGLRGNRLFYFAVAPVFFASLAQAVVDTGLTRPNDTAWARVVIEKPFGHDLASAVDLDRKIHAALAPEQVYRIDHYLGKDTVQNLMAFRFGNSIFEPVFNRRYVDHVQITVAETVGMEGKRGGYYDKAGALRDIVQNHMLQLLAFVAMEAPATLTARDMKDAKLRVVRDLLPITGAEVDRRIVRGQYTAGDIGGESDKGYREEYGVAPDSTTETFVAIRAEVESWRWAGVPFLLRTGKRMAHRVTEVAIYFRQPPLKLFRTVECEGDFCDLSEAHPNVLAFRIQPEEGITLSFAAKRPGMGVDLTPVKLAFDYAAAYHHPLPEAYERLIFDALRGDQTLFMRSDELEAAWEFITPILDEWQAHPVKELPAYKAGSWGPTAADRLTDGLCHDWRHP